MSDQEDPRTADPITHSMANTAARDADGDRPADTTVWSRAERAWRLGTALSRMAHDLAAIERENRRLYRENAVLHRRIEQLEAEHDER